MTSPQMVVYRRQLMRNAKNPFMSVWLSAANKFLATSRAQASATAKREASAFQAEVARETIAFWSGKSAGRKPRR
jgi:hypothetical protein